MKIISAKAKNNLYNHLRVHYFAMSADEEMWAQTDNN
jgi:hypothetical protein